MHTLPRSICPLLTFYYPAILSHRNRYPIKMFNGLNHLQLYGRAQSADYRVLTEVAFSPCVLQIEEPQRHSNTLRPKLLWPRLETKKWSLPERLGVITTVALDETPSIGLGA